MQFNCSSSLNFCFISVRGVFVIEQRRTFVRPNVQIWTNINVNEYDPTVQNEQTDKDEATYVTPKRNKDEDKYDLMIQNKQTDKDKAT